MKRGEVWTVSGGKDYAGKPRPVVIMQDDAFDETDSITICAFTTDPTEAPLFRLLVAPNARNGLRSPSRLMVDKISTIPPQFSAIFLSISGVCPLFSPLFWTWLTAKAGGHSGASEVARSVPSDSRRTMSQ
jgi:mRNA-degrading endonuclease toxin of MazEF toxin-antitoxin module